MRRIIKRLVLFVGVCCFINGLLGNVGVYASGMDHSSLVYQKAQYTNLVNCYKQQFVDNITLDDFQNANSLLKDTSAEMPTIGDEKSKIKCSTLFTAETGLIPPDGLTQDKDKRADNLEKVGYELDPAYVNEEKVLCYAYPYTLQISVNDAAGDIKHSKKYDESTELCITRNPDGTFKTSTGKGGGDGVVMKYTHPGNNTLKVRIDVGGKGFVTDMEPFDLSEYKNESEIFVAVGKHLNEKIGASYNPEKNFYTEQYEPVGVFPFYTYEYTKTYYYAACESYKAYSNNGGVECMLKDVVWDAYSKRFPNTGTRQGTENWVKSLKGEGAIASRLSGDTFQSWVTTTKSGLAFSNMDIYNLYQYYIQNNYGVKEVVCRENAATGVGYGGKDGNGVKLWWAEKNKWNDHCYLKLSDEDNKNKKVNGVDGTNHFGTPVDLDAIIDKLNSFKFTNSQLPETTLVINNQPTEEQKQQMQQDAGETTQDCLSAGGAGSLGWVVCPIAQKLEETIDTIYEDYLAPMLRVRVDAFDTAQNDSAYKAWDIFRNMANIVFVILFLVVIFSQLTGVGIDNYGIKKLLPKLILIAVIINLSYWICVVCVDISNIIGNSLKELFDGIEVTFTQGIKVDGTAAIESLSDPDKVNQLASSGGVFAIVVIVGIAVLFIQGAIANPATLLPLLLALLGVLIGVFFLFIMLAARQAAIVCFTVVSPILIVLYVMPNTKRRIFDKWIKICDQLLMTYPVCGLLIGGGNYASRLLLANGGQNFFELLTACAVGIAPIFFIPSVVTSALNGLGGLGSKIQGLGNKLSSGAQRAIDNSGMARNAKKAGEERRNRFAANRDYMRNVRRTGTWIDKDGNQHEAKNAKGPLGSIYRARDRIAGSGFGQFMGWDRRIGEASEQQSAKWNEMNKHRNSFNEKDNIMKYEADKAKGQEEQRIGRAQEGYKYENRNVWKKKQEEENNVAGAVNNKGYIPKSLEVAEQEQVAKNNHALALNKEGVTPESVNSIREKMRAQNEATKAGNFVVQQNGIQTKGVATNIVDAYQRSHEAESARETVQELRESGVGLEEQAKSVDSFKVEHHSRANATIAGNEKVSKLAAMGIDVQQQAKSVDANLVEQFGQAQAVIGQNREVAERVAAAGGDHVDAAQSLARSIASGQVEQAAQLNATASQNQAIATQLATPGARAADLVKSVDAGKVEQFSQFNAIRGANRAVGQQQADGHSLMDQAKSADVAYNEQMNTITRTMANNLAGGPALVGLDNETQRVTNANVQAEANEGQPVPVLRPEVAQQRAISNVNATELRNAQDMYGAMSRSDIASHIGNLGSILARGDRGSTQQAIALFRAAQEHGLENEAFRALKAVPSDQIDDTFKSALTGSKDKVVQAWAKSRPVPEGDGERYMTLDEFMRSDDGLQRYISEKGPSVIPSLDDKSLHQIAAVDRLGHHAMDTSLLVEAASTMKSQDAIREINDMLSRRTDITLSGEQLANINLSTFNTLSASGSGAGALRTAYDAIRNDAQLMAKVDPQVREQLEARFGAASGTPTPTS